MSSNAVGSVSRRAASRMPRGLLAALCIGVLTFGCSGGFKMPGIPGFSRGSAAEGRDAGPRPGEIRDLVFDEWYEDSIHCAQKHCENVYSIVVAEAGALRADVYAPWGADTPDIDLALLDESGVAIARPLKPNARPRRVEKQLEPGRYLLRVRSRGHNEGRLKYDVVAKLSRAKKAPARTPAAPRRPVTRVVEPEDRPTVPPAEPARAAAAPKAARPRDLLVTAEVLGVEKEGEGAAFVLLDAGEPDRVAAGMRGRLVEGGVSIGEVVIVEVYTDGSRARVIGDLTGEVGIDTVAEIFE